MKRVVKYGVKNDVNNDVKKGVKKGVTQRGCSCTRNPRWLTLLFTFLFTVFFTLLFTYKSAKKRRARGPLVTSVLRRALDWVSFSSSTSS
jgi:hypothetical protein